MAIKIDPQILQNAPLAEKALTHESEVERAKIEQGILGRVWGGKDSTPSNVAGLISMAAFTAGIIYTFVVINIQPDKLSISIKDFWAIMVPIITLSIGYLFGHKPKGN